MVFYTLFFLLPGNLATLFTIMATLVTITAADRVVWAARQLR